MTHHDGPSRVVVDLGAYAHNLGVARRFAESRAQIIAVVKADAYGHGAVPVARAAARAGVSMLGVATVWEGVEIRDAGVDIPVLVMVSPPARDLPAVVAHDLTLAVSDVETAARIGELAREAGRLATVHCKVDTGMGRQGFSLEEAPGALQQIARITHVDLEGVGTHFPAADEPDDPGTMAQIKAFRQLLRQLERMGVPFGTAHAANSAALINYTDSLFDAVRPGLITYGVWPAGRAPGQNLLRRALRWETTVVQVRDLPAGATISYGRTFTASAPMRAAVLPVGYADGYRIALSNNADVLIRGRRCPVRGRVCMDQTVVDVTGLHDVRCGDTATLIGGDGDQIITVEELAKRAGTIPYDILTGIGKRVVRTHTGAAG